MIYPHTVEMSWGGDVELEARDLPDWAEAQPLTWTISSGQGSIIDLGGIKIRYIGPQAGPDVPDKTVIHVFAGDEIVGECTITLKVILPIYKPEPLPGIPKEPDPDPPPKEEDVVPTVDCGVDPEHPEEPLKVRPTEVMAGPEEEVTIGIEKIWEVCEEGCYTWRIAYGGGKLLCNCGRQAIYLTPSVNGECEANAMIELIYCERVIAECYVTINTWDRRGEAYVLYDRDAHWDWGDYDPAWRGAQSPSPPPGVLAPSWFLRDYASIYDCGDRLIRKFDYLQQWWHCSWVPIRKEWQIYCSARCYGPSGFKTLEEIPMGKIRYPYPKDKDLRRPWMKTGGCCPLGLVGIAYLIQ